MISRNDRSAKRWHLYGNLTGDPWFTDENRAVMLLTSAPTSVIEIEWFDWMEDGAN